MVVVVLVVVMVCFVFCVVRVCDVAIVCCSVLIVFNTSVVVPITPQRCVCLCLCLWLSKSVVFGIITVNIQT